MGVEPVNEMLAWMKVLLLTAVIILGTREFLFEPVAVEGHSMEPTFHEEDKLLLWKITRIENFDMVVFRAPDGSRYIKRVIGIPGNRLMLIENRLYLNGKRLEETYLDAGESSSLTATGRSSSEFTVPPGSYYVLGDNRNNSTDSRMIGFIQEEDIIGEVKFRFAPIADFGRVE